MTKKNGIKVIPDAPDIPPDSVAIFGETDIILVL